ncbi:flippase [Bifidobacterium adolescentis]
MQFEHSVRFNAVMNTILTASNMLIGVITIPYITRTLSVEGYGNVTFAQNISQWLSALCLVGIPTYGVRECARARDDPRKLASVVRELLAIITVCTLTVLACFALAIAFVPRLHGLAALMCMFLVSTLLLSFGVEWFFQAMEEYEYITIRSVAFKVLSFIAMLLLVRADGDYLVYGAITAFVTCGNNVLNLIRLGGMVDLRTSAPLHIRRHIKPLASFAAQSIATSIYLFFDSILLGMLSADNVQVGFYQLAAKLKGVCWSVINAIVGVLVPRLSYYAKHSLGQYRDLMGKGFGIVCNLCCGLCCYLLVETGPLTIWVSTGKYADAITAVRIIGLVSLFSCMSTFLASCVLTPLDQESKLAVSNMAGVPISLAGNLLLDAHLGATGAALSMLAAEIVIFVLETRYCWDVLRESISLRRLARIGACHACSTAALLALLYGAPAMDCAAQVLAGMSIYCLVWLLAGLIFHEETVCWTIGVIRGKLPRK